MTSPEADPGSDSDDSASSTHGEWCDGEALTGYSVYHLYLTATGPIPGLDWAGRGAAPIPDDGDDLAPLWDALGDSGHIWDRSSTWVPVRSSIEAAIDWSSVS